MCERSACKQATVLVVDDDEFIRHATSLRLASNGYEVLKASRGDDGVAIAKSQQPDVIVMDIRMPGLDGLAALRLLRTDPTTDAIPVVMLSASPENQNAVLDSGAQFFLQKPYSKESLLSAVQAALDSSN
ncbi:MAG: response regulator [Pirellulaceae bacterium]|nr:response regulator [Pirellulaceae bacterium]